MKLSDLGFETLKEEDTKKLLEGHRDILTPMVKAQHERLSQQSCPSCGGRLELSLAPRPFTANSPLPRYIGKCLSCKDENINVS
jgi:hypothetical protein